jgi:bifunctional non-homologous end joining protein LigD
VSTRADKIYIDFLQNRKGQTIAAPFSVRPKPGATVSFPLHWEQVNHDLKISNYTLFNVPELVKNWNDPWKDLKKNPVKLEKLIGIMQEN